jgi:hypothetical protein
LQIKGGGNWTVRGCLFVDSKYPMVAAGAITMLREYGEDGFPNFVPWAGSQGNSLTFERNVFVGHYPRPIIWFFTPGGVPLQALYAAGDTSVGPERRLSSLIVRDNIAMLTSTATRPSCSPASRGEQFDVDPQRPERRDELGRSRQQHRDLRRDRGAVR